MPWRKSAADRRSDARNYGTEYRRNRGAAMRRDGWRCQLRLEGCQGAASECDHIVSVADGGSHDVSNLRAACASCHARHTATQGRGYRRGAGADPEPRQSTAWLPGASRGRQAKASREDGGHPGRGHGRPRRQAARRPAAKSTPGDTPGSRQATPPGSSAGRHSGE
jgi:hypothetical protein